MSKRTEAAIALIIVGVACIAGLRVATKPAAPPPAECFRADWTDFPPEAIVVAPRELSTTQWI